MILLIKGLLGCYTAHGINCANLHLVGKKAVKVHFPFTPVL